MPIYEYKCSTCGKEIEVLQSNHKNYEDCSDIDSNCEKHGKVARLISSFAYTGATSQTENSECIYSSKSKEHVHSGGCGCHGGFCSAN